MAVLPHLERACRFHMVLVDAGGVVMQLIMQQVRHTGHAAAAAAAAESAAFTLRASRVSRGEDACYASVAFKSRCVQGRGLIAREPAVGTCPCEDGAAVRTASLWERVPARTALRGRRRCAALSRKSLPRQATDSLRKCRICPPPPPPGCVCVCGGGSLKDVTAADDVSLNGTV